MSQQTSLARFQAYLLAYEQKNIDDIAAMLASDVTLRDWKICVQGKEAALAETRANFAAAQSIQIDILRVYESASAVAGELRIMVDGHIELFVVDAVDFNAAGQISAIRAFLGRGDA
ncbi:nuclear transport factor 2 family protein [Silvimonas iriomotensis]|nr:nuclear transport factor 2 family protein [Silvimonas iriomotensis]